MKRFTKILFPISVALFMCSIALGLFGRAFCTRSNDDYKSIQPESFVPDTIETVLHDKDLKQIYVCYNDANCVNAYSDNGEFLWCVATPYIRNSCFELQNDKLIIYDGDAYIYNSKNGSFLGIENEENLDLNYDYENEYTEQLIEGELYFDEFQVYKALGNGELKTIVSRPWWHNIFNFSLTLSLSFIGALGVGISSLLEKIMDFVLINKTVVLKNPKTKFIKKYFKITSIVHIVYVILNIISAFGNCLMILGIIPITLHMIISSIILWNIPSQLLSKSEEMRIVNFWGTIEITSYIVAFLSVVIVIGIVG